MPEYNVDRIRQIMVEINAALRKLSGYAEISENRKIHQILKEDIQDIKDYLKIINKAVT